MTLPGSRARTAQGKPLPLLHAATVEITVNSVSAAKELASRIDRAIRCRRMAFSCDWLDPAGRLACCYRHPDGGVRAMTGRYCLTVFGRVPSAHRPSRNACYAV
jgi:hypothetical protein